MTDCFLSSLSSDNHHADCCHCCDHKNQIKYHMTVVSGSHSSECFIRLLWSIGCFTIFWYFVTVSKYNIVTACFCRKGTLAVITHLNCNFEFSLSYVMPVCLSFTSDTVYSCVPSSSEFQIFEFDFSRCIILSFSNNFTVNIF